MNLNRQKNGEKTERRNQTKEDQTAQTKNDDFRLYFVVHNHSAGSLCSQCG